MKCKFFSALLMAAVMTVAVTGCAASPDVNTGMSAQSGQSSKPEAVSSGIAQSASAAWEIQIDTVTLDGEAVTSEDLSGNKLTVMNVWATWCPPCVDELPHLQEMSQAFADKGVEVVGVLQDGVSELGVRSDRTIENANKLLEEAGASYRVILPDTVIMETFIAQMQYFPTTFFLDQSGNVVETVVGAHNAAEWEEIINGALEKVSQ